MSLYSLLNHVTRHPLNRGGRTRALMRVLHWQFVSRLGAAAIAVPFVNDTRLLMRSGMTGATGNWYCGLHEPHDMGFALHYLRQNPGKLVELASLLGHESLDTTALYTRPSIDDLAEDLERSRLNVYG